MIRRLTAAPHRRGAALALVVALCAALLSACGTSEAVRGSSDTCTTARPLTAGLTAHTLEHDGDDRSYAMYVPQSYDGTTRTRTVFLFHGYGGTPEKVLQTTGMETLAEKQGFIVVAPLARGAVSESKWDFRSPGSVVNSDVSFVRDLVDEVRTEGCVDPTGLFAAGFSNGAAFALALACDPQSRFSAYGAVAGPYIAPDCAQAKPASIAYFHGKVDSVVPVSGASTVIGPLPPVADTIADWVAHDRCPATGALTQADDSVEHFNWSDCADGTQVSVYLIADAGHRWPGQVVGTPGKGAGPTVEDVDASRLMWSFFRSAQQRQS